MMSTLNDKHFTVVGVGNIGRILLERLAAAEPALINPLRMRATRADREVVEALAINEASILRAGPPEKELWGGEPATTNNRMELMAAIAALELSLIHISEPTRPY